MMINFDMTIDINRGGFPFGIDIRMRRERFQSRFIQGFKKDLAGGLEFLKKAVVEDFQLF